MYSRSMKLGKNRHLLCAPSHTTPTQKLVLQICLPPSYFAAEIKSQIQPVLEIEIFALKLQILIAIIQI